VPKKGYTLVKHIRQAIEPGTSCTYEQLLWRLEAQGSPVGAVLVALLAAYQNDEFTIWHSDRIWVEGEWQASTLMVARRPAEDE
jgi:hypothetical protein